jgi:hypothetical protein
MDLAIEALQKHLWTPYTIEWFIKLWICNWKTSQNLFLTPYTNLISCSYFCLFWTILRNYGLASWSSTKKPFWIPCTIKWIEKLWMCQLKLYKKKKKKPLWTPYAREQLKKATDASIETLQKPLWNPYTNFISCSFFVCFEQFKKLLKFYKTLLNFIYNKMILKTMDVSTKTQQKLLWTP